MVVRVQDWLYAISQQTFEYHVLKNVPQTIAIFCLNLRVSFLFQLLIVCDQMMVCLGPFLHGRSIPNTTRRRRRPLYAFSTKTNFSRLVMPNTPFDRFIPFNRSGEI